VIITGGIDLSVGSVFALLGVLLSIFLVDWHIPAAFAVLAVLAISTSLGLINGLMVTKVKIQPFIVTLCGLLIYRGLARFIANDETKGIWQRRRVRDIAEPGNRESHGNSDTLHYSDRRQLGDVGRRPSVGIRTVPFRARP
jgi:ribose/xylose/arabinose/galactoside ABC-type transport system permease subunit